MSIGSGPSRDFPQRIFAIASPNSIGGASLFTPGVTPTSRDIGRFTSDEALVQRAVLALEDAGFEVLQATDVMVNFAGAAETFERAFGIRLFTEERPVIKPGSRPAQATFIDRADAAVSGLIETAGTSFADLLEGVAIEQPYYPQGVLAQPPEVAYWHLDVPDDVAAGLRADAAQERGVTGAGIRIAMVDTGFARHPFYDERGYLVEPTVLGPGTSEPEVDGSGHGTGEAANIFAAAPEVMLLPVKTATSSGALVNVTAALNTAAGLGVQVITNSWGSSLPKGPLSPADQALAAAVASAVAGGMVVVFSAGNGSWGFPGQHPDVISAGGVYLAEDGSLQASNYASGFMSSVYPGRRVPDVCGLVGMLPSAMYILLPVPPGSALDVGQAGGQHPEGDETRDDDGWAAFSGTSAAAPQLAGVSALLLQVQPGLSPAEVRELLMDTARDVVVGTNHPTFGNVAVPGPDTATGNGLVDAGAAVRAATETVERVGSDVPPGGDAAGPPSRPVSWPASRS